MVGPWRTAMKPATAIFLIAVALQIFGSIAELAQLLS
jgi:hypothetical protein